MNDLEEIFRNASNQMAQAFYQMTNQPAQMLAEAQQLQTEALKQYHHEIMVARIQSFIAALAIAFVLYRIWTWFRNTERHLKTIAEATVQNNSSASSPVKQDETITPPISDPPPVPPSPPEHPHARYMPK